MDASPDDPIRVFVCHASEDKARVQKLAEDLRASVHIFLWIDESSIPGGSKWEEEIEEAIRRSDVALLCQSRHSGKRSFLQQELKLIFKEADKCPEKFNFLIPVKLEPCQLSHANLNKLQVVELYSDGGFEKLIAALKEQATLLGRTISWPTEIALTGLEQLQSEAVTMLRKQILEDELSLPAWRALLKLLSYEPAPLRLAAFRFLDIFGFRSEDVPKPLFDDYVQQYFSTPLTGTLDQFLIGAGSGYYPVQVWCSKVAIIVLFEKKRILRVPQYKLEVRMWGKNAGSATIEPGPELEVQALTNAYLSFRDCRGTKIIAVDGHFRKDANGAELFSSDAPGHQLRWDCSPASKTFAFLNAKIGLKNVMYGGDFIRMDAVKGPQFTFPTWSYFIVVDLRTLSG